MLACQVEVDLDLNAHANARRWHGDRKARSAKQAKTLDAASRALKVAEKKAQVQLSKVWIPITSWNILVQLFLSEVTGWYLIHTVTALFFARDNASMGTCTAGEHTDSVVPFLTSTS